MRSKLLFQALGRFSAGVAAVALLVFLPAGTLAYRQGWLFMGILFIPMLAAGVLLLAKNPWLLQKRLNSKERQPEQRAVIRLSAVLFLAGFMLCGLNFRFGWLILPGWTAYAAAGIFLLAYGLYAETLRENAYASRTVEVQQGQRVVDTGLYGIVRHPMYTAALLLFLSMPLVLGSLISFLLFLAFPLIIARRIRSEEELLEEELPGYREYKQRVKYRLLPYIW